MNLLLISQIGFALLTIIFAYFILKIFKRAIAKTSWPEVKKRKVFLGILASIVGWLIFVCIWSASGIMSNFEIFPLNFIPIIALPLIVIVALVFFSSALKDILMQIRPDKIVMLQNFRIFVEILLWLLFVAAMLPEQMTFEGRNFDVLSGITAPVVAWLFAREKISRGVAIIWNLICLGLLVNIVTIAILSTPTPWRIFFEEPANTVVTLFCISFLPGFLVPLAYTLHFFSLKQLLITSAAPK